MFLAPLAILGMLLFIAIGGGVVQYLWNWRGRRETRQTGARENRHFAPLHRCGNPRCLRQL